MAYCKSLLNLKSAVFIVKDGRTLYKIVYDASKKEQRTKTL